MKSIRETDVANLVSRLRKQMHLTQEQFAQKVGTTYSTVNHWENGKRMPQPFFVRRLLELNEELDKSLDQKGNPSTREDA